VKKKNVGQVHHESRHPKKEGSSKKAPKNTQQWIADENKGE